jgi:hypothetical protein
VGQDERPAPLQAVIGEELHPALGEVALPLLVVEDLDEVQRLAAAAICWNYALEAIIKCYYYNSCS